MRVLFEHQKSYIPYIGGRNIAENITSNIGRFYASICVKLKLRAEQ